MSAGLANAQGQSQPPVLSPQVIADMQRLQDAALASGAAKAAGAADADYAWQIAAHLSDNIGPRMSGSAQYAKAAQYIAEQMKAAGFEVRLEKVMSPHWVRGEERAALVEWPGMAQGTRQTLAVTALGRSVATPPEGITADVVVVGSFDELRALGREKVAGKVVLYAAKFDRRLAAAGLAEDAYGEVVVYRGRGATEASRLGAVASLIRSAGGAPYRLPHTGGLSYAKDVTKIPGGALAAEDAEMIERLAKQGRVRMHLVMTPQTLPEVEEYNVIGDIRGTEHPEQVVILSGHLDSWDLGTGALDDAAGVAAAMGAGRLVKQLGLKPKRTLRVIAWANEEYGLRGGLGYARQHQAELANQFAAIETDLGTGRPLGMRADVDVSAKPALEAIAKVLARQGAGSIEYTDNTGADLIPLSVQGVPTFAPKQDNRTYFDYHHTPADTLDKIDPQELKENVAFQAVLGYALANLEQPLKGAKKELPAWMKEE